MTRFGGNIGWIRDYRKAVSGSSCVARAALQLHSIKRRSRCTAVFPGVSVLSKPTPALSKCLKLKCRVTSQAGRRRFESGLPLHVINNLQAPRIWPAPKCSIYITNAFSMVLTAWIRLSSEDRV